MRVRQLLYHLWSHIERCSLDTRQYLRVVAHMSSKTKVTQLNDSIARYQYVLRFHITMCDPVRVKIVECPDKLLRNLPKLAHIVT